MKLLAIIISSFVINVNFAMMPPVSGADLTTSRCCTNLQVAAPSGIAFSEMDCKHAREQREIPFAHAIEIPNNSISHIAVANAMPEQVSQNAVQNICCVKRWWESRFEYCQNYVPNHPRCTNGFAFKSIFGTLVLSGALCFLISSPFLFYGKQ